VPSEKTQARVAFIGCGGHATRSLLPCVGELQTFARSLLRRTPSRADLTDGAKALKVGEAAWRSIKQGRAVTLD